MNIQIFGKSKCFDTKKAERYFKERRIKYQLVDVVKETACRLLGAEHVTLEREPDLGTEDFSYFAEARPACFWHLGCANFKRGIDADIHNCRFDLDEDCLAVGAAIQAEAALALLG